jgi:1-acyl-sn-glycerol-3-phosphate acyltransferase
MIPVDRSGKAASLSRMMKAANKAKDEGRKIVIFPQGTRVPPGVKAPYKVGVAALYQQLKLPVVPMALNSGLFWGKHAFIKKPGTITIEFLPPIPASLPRARFMREMEEQIETASDRLALSANAQQAQ